MNRKSAVLLILVPIIVGLVFTTPFIYNWQRNKELVGQNIELILIETANKIVDDEFIPVIYLAFAFSYCVTLIGIVSIYLIESKEKTKDKSKLLKCPKCKKKKMNYKFGHGYLCSNCGLKIK